MKHNVLLTITSLLSILFGTFHLADDIARGMSPRAAVLSSLYEFNPSIRYHTRFDSFAPAHLPLPSRLCRLCCSSPNCSIRSRCAASTLRWQLTLFSLGS